MKLTLFLLFGILSLSYANTLANKDSIVEENNKKQILVLIPIGLPGMGKTTYLTLLKALLEERNSTLTVVGSDTIRKQLMDDLIKKNPGMNEKTAFDKTGKNTAKRFSEEIENAIKKTASIKQNTHVIFLDKNHPPNILGNTIKSVTKPQYMVNNNIKTIILKPSASSQLHFDSIFYPFSQTFILTCINRANHRKGHETLSGTDLKITSVLMTFLKFYKNFNATESDFKALGADLLMELPFTHEDPEIEKMIPRALTKSIQDVLDVKGFKADQTKVAQFLDEFSKLEIELKNPDPTLLEKKSVEGLNQCFELFKHI